MIVLDANLWIAAFDPVDRFHRDSVAVLRAALEEDRTISGPTFVLLETCCALARRSGSADVAAVAHAEISSHPALRLEPLDDDLLARAERLGVALRLRASDALYAATAERLDCPLLSWDRELVERANALSPAAWLVGRPAGTDLVFEPVPEEPPARGPTRRRSKRPRRLS